MARTKKEKSTEVSKYSSVVEQYFAESAAGVKEKYGSDMVSSATEEDGNLQYIYVPDLGFQWALGRKGFALGRVMQILAAEGSGKTSLGLWIADLCMRAGGLSCLIETEQAGSTKHMRAYLSKPEEFRVFHPTSIEGAMRMTLDQLNLFLKLDPEGEIPKCIVIDSIAGSSDERLEEDEENFVQQKVGGVSKQLKDWLNLCKNKIKETNTLLVLVNQGREAIATGFAARVPVAEIDKLIGSGGKAIPFVSTYNLILKRQSALKDSSGEEKDGFKTKLTLKKNKIGVPFREINYNIRWNKSFDFVEATTSMLASGEIGGFQQVKGPKFFSDEMGIPKERALTAQEFYDFAHDPSRIEVFQQELDIVLDDKILTYEHLKKEEDQLNTESGIIPSVVLPESPVE